jgi:amino acid transporter, AAT family
LAKRRFSGSFSTYATRFFSPSYGFALSWNYWFNDAVSVASDLTAAQLVLQYWTPWHSWVISLLFWVFLVGVNATHVKAYGEMGKSFSLITLSYSCRFNFYHRILACLTESCYDHHLYYHWHSRECWRQPRAPLYWWPLLAYTWRTIRWWIRWIRQCVCYCQFRM